MELFFQSYQKIIKPSDKLVLAVSGGVDSMVLLHLVMVVHPHENIIIAHVDHSLRGAESDADRVFVADFCNRMGICSEMNKTDVDSLAKDAKMSIEVMARNIRYEFFEQVREKHNAKYILTAHHADDQIETILLNIIKGGKIHGLSGMAELSGYIFRPMLGLSKDEIRTHAQDNGIPFREDSSNQDNAFERNKIRNDILPVLKSINPTLHETFSELGEYMQEATKHLDQSVISWLQSAQEVTGKEKSFYSESFLSLQPFFQREVIAYLYREAQGGSSQGLSKGLIAELMRFIADKNSYGKKQIKNLRMERRGEIIRVIT